VARSLIVALAWLAACSTTPSIDLGARPIGVSVEAKMHYYDVSAATLAEIRRAMMVQGPRADGRSWTAVTRWRYAWTFQYDNRGTVCHIRDVKVRLQTVIEFPRWNPTAEPDSALMEWWQQMNAGLAEHERGHAQLAMETAGEIVKSLDGMMGGRCDVLGQQAGLTGRRLIDAGNRKQVEYDAATRHGVTQIQQARRLREP
jgi:predicted secreted Zn-dependent protease